MSRKNNGQEEPRDPLNDELMEIVKSERAFTEIDSNRYEREVIKDKLEMLREAKKRRQAEAGKKEPAETFLSGSTYEEIAQTAEELPTNKYNLYMILVTSLDRIKKLKPKEARQELRALVKMVATRDPSEIQKAFFEGFELGGKTQRDIINNLRAAKSQEAKSKVIAEVFTKITERSDSLTRTPVPMLITLSQNTGYAAPGGSLEFVASVFGGTAPVDLYARNYPKDMTMTWTPHAITYPAPGVQGQASWKLPSSAHGGEYEITLTAKDAGGKTADATYYLTVT